MLPVHKMLHPLLGQNLIWKVMFNLISLEYLHYKRFLLLKNMEAKRIYQLTASTNLKSLEV